MPSTIRAAVCRSFGAPLQIETLTLRDPGPSEIEVTLEAVAICHSDISYLEGAWGGALPAVYGHEAAGRVTALGQGVTKTALGARVLVTLIRSCGTCPNCASGKPVYCSGKTDRAPKLTDASGAPVTAAMECGAFAEKVIVDQSQIAPLGEAAAPHSACLLACGVPTGVGAVVNTARVRPGDTVVVIGAGGVGLNTVQGARIAGAARIVAMDLEPSKLEDARAFGATDTMLATVEKPWQRLEQITGGRLADHVFVTVGAVPAYELALRLIAPGGTAYAVGMPASGAMSSYEPVVVAALGQGLRGSKMGDVVLSRDIPWMFDLYAQGRLKLDELVSRQWPFEQINAAIADTNAGQARRNVLIF
jgi:Zn-dependent alcohol dehydrogenase